MFSTVLALCFLLIIKSSLFKPCFDKNFWRRIFFCKSPNCNN